MQKTRRYWHEEIGYNYRLTNLQAAIGVAQFERLSEFVSAKKFAAQKYNDAFSGIDCIQIPAQVAGLENSYWLYTMLIKPHAPFKRDDMIQHLLNKGIETRPVFFTMHEMPPYSSFGDADSLQISTIISQCGISLPSSVNLLEEELDHICQSIISFVQNQNVLIQ